MYMSRSLMTECVRPNLAIRSRSSMCFEGRNVVLEQAGSRSRFREKADTANDAEVVSFRASSLFSKFNTMSTWVTYAYLDYKRQKCNSYLVSAECADRMCFLKIFSDSEVKSQNRQSSSTSSSTSLCLWSLFLSSPLAFDLAFVTRTLLDLPMLSSDLALTPSTCFDLVRLFGILWSSGQMG